MQTVTMPKDQLDTLNKRISHLERVLIKLAEKMRVPEEEIEPAYGSDEWWAWSDRRAREDLKDGRVIKLETKEDIDTFFDNL
jgi:hypothetical protein